MLYNSGAKLRYYFFPQNLFPRFVQESQNLFSSFVQESQNLFDRNYRKS